MVAILRNKTEYIVKFAAIILIFILLLVCDALTGSNKISIRLFFDYIFSPDSIPTDLAYTIKEFRIARVFTSIIAGAALSVSGLLMQTVFRNPLAGPYVLGISNGAGLGVAVVVLGSGLFFNYQVATISNFVILLAAGLGAAAVLILILAVSFKVKDILSILIAGILVSGVVSSIVSILQFFSNEINVKSYVVWTMGSLDSVSFSDVLILIPICSICTLVLFMFSKKLNILLLGEQFAQSMGVNIKQLRIIIFLGVSVLTGSVTAFCGPLGFIGLAVPHISRWIFNSSNHFILIPATIIMGACFLLCGDILSHSLYTSGILPINAVISILGAPFVIWIVFKNKRTVI